MVPRLATLAALFPLVAVAMSAAGCRKKQPPAAEPPEVVVSEPLSRDYTEYAYYTGRLAAVETQEVKARVAGPIVSVDFQEGAVVEPGDILYRIDPRTFRADYDSAVSKVRANEATLASATDDYNRKVTSGFAASPSEITQAEQRVAGARADVATARSDVESKRLNLEFTTIRADIGGVISRTLVTRGNIVQPGQSGGTLLTTIVTMDPIYAYFDVDERTVQRVHKMIREKKFVTDELRKIDPHYTAMSTLGLFAGCAPASLNTCAALYPGKSFAVVPIRLELENETGFPHKGYIDFVDNQVNPSTGTLRIRGLFSNGDRVLTPGFFVRVRVPVSPPQKALMVPDSAVVTDQDQKVLYLLNDKDEVIYRPVVLGGLQDGMRVIEQGLVPTDRVIVNGLQRVRPGVVARAKKDE